MGNNISRELDMFKKRGIFLRLCTKCSKSNSRNGRTDSRPQYYTSDLSQVIGKIVKVHVVQRNTGTQIGKKMFVSRNELRDTIIHEELHQRRWKRGINE